MDLLFRMSKQYYNISVVPAVITVAKNRQLPSEITCILGIKSWQMHGDPE